MSEHKFTNALANETSPYLLQHAHNPVQWYPWSPEALKRSKTEDKPILLSIGYSACHWCHVMEHESFENEDIATLMNQHFISIKVDREERPDLDAIYMSAVQTMTGSGGWPLTVFLTPDLVPFYGGTYFPPTDRHGMVGFPRLLLSVARAYSDRKIDIEKQSAAVLGALKQNELLGTAEGELTIQSLDIAAGNLKASYDARDGGFGHAPKFPPAMTLTFLLRSYLRTEDQQLLDMVEQTLTKMAQGGIYDQLGGGFHRYSVDGHWLVPHFEKMLYDNALLSRVYLDAYLLTKRDLFRQVVEETLDYVVREMTSPEGGFYSTQDADSEGEEGKFYLWTAAEVKDLLGGGDAELFCHYYDISPEGNFERRNILHVPRVLSTAARLAGVPEERLLAAIQRGRKVLFEAREKRVKPGRDEKILTAWNGLMIRSFAEAGSGLERDDYRAVAARAAGFVLSTLQPAGRLLRTCRSGEAKLNAYLEDHAFLANALLSLYEATFDPRWMMEAERLVRVLIERFSDPQGGGFFFTSSDHERLPHRPKEYFDNATPSGNSEAAWALLRLWRFTGEGEWAQFAVSLLKRMAEPMARHPLAFGNLLCALDFFLSKCKEIAVVGEPAAKQTRMLLNEIFRRYLPNKVVACGATDSVALLRNRRCIHDAPTAYVCEDFACRAPVTTPSELAALLK